MAPELMTAPSYVQGALFEQGFLLRTLGAISHEPDVALTELVANSWDAGAANVRITIPDRSGGELRVSDDGAGMLHTEFVERWMRLGYDRRVHQGKDADFPPERADWKRIAYGRNGVGRHGLLCFADEYTVTTEKGGELSWFHVSTSTEDQPFVLLEKKLNEGTGGHGTELLATVTRHLPDADSIRQILSSRFIHDPQFTIWVNGAALTRAELPGQVDEADLTTKEGTKLRITCYDTNKSAVNTLRQGVAFWVSRRLVGEPSWTLGRYSPIDGRTQFGKRYTFIVECDDLADDVLADWTGFRRGPRIEAINETVAGHVGEVCNRLSATRIEETKEMVYRNHAERLRELSGRSRQEVATVVERIVERSPSTSSETLDLVVGALVGAKQSTSMQSVLQKLVTLSETDVQGLDRFLNDWDVSDALTVLDEVDNRLAVVEAIKRLSGDPKSDELHALHPLVTEARWVFGPEFDTPEYASNVTIRNAVERVFKDRCDPGAFENPQKRPDILVLRDATISAVGLDVIEPDGLARTRDLLVIELKRGQSTIGRDEMNQANGYVEDIRGCGLIDRDVKIRAFVVGHVVAAKVDPRRKIGEPEHSTIQAINYGTLVQTAERRLFGLRQRLNDRYGDLQRDTMPASLRRALAQQQLGLTGLDPTKP